MKKSTIFLLPLVVACAISAALAGCHSQSVAKIDDRNSFKGGQMPANVGQIIAQRAQASEARVHSTGAH